MNLKNTVVSESRYRRLCIIWLHLNEISGVTNLVNGDSKDPWLSRAGSKGWGLMGRSTSDLSGVLKMALLWSQWSLYVCQNSKNCILKMGIFKFIFRNSFYSHNTDTQKITMWDDGCVHKLIVVIIL